MRQILDGQVFNMRDLAIDRDGYTWTVFVLAGDFPDWPPFYTNIELLP